MDIETLKFTLNSLSGKKFGDIFNSSQMAYIMKNKGKSSSIFELAINSIYPLSSKDLYFDCEISTMKCNCQGIPLETVFIEQISRCIDDLLNCNDFYNSQLFNKIKNRMIIPICKEGNPYDWEMLSCIHIDFNNKDSDKIFLQLEHDYYSICKQLIDFIENSSDGFIHTSNGEFIQIRSKDSKPYLPIYSNKYNKYISNKNHAFYFKKDFFKYQTNNI